MTLKVEGLSKSFDGKPVLQNINFQLATGEILAILGRSGAGKTTLLRCINHLEKCDRGTIQIAGMDLCRDEADHSVYAKPAELRKIRKEIGLVFQSFNLFPHMSVLENITAAPIHSYGISKQAAMKKAMELLEMLELSDKADAYPYQLSGGQRQRVAIARACALEPKIMSLDEPTSALDPELREGIALTIERLAATGMGILLITHDMNFAKRVAQRVIFMEDGRIIEEGSKEEFFGNMENERVKRFVGV